MSGRGTIGRAVQDAASRWVWYPVHGGMRAARAGTRVSFAAYRESLAFRDAAVAWSDERRTEWMLARLRRAVRIAATTPFYRERFAAVGFDPAADFGFDDYARLPVLERAEIQAAGTALRVPGVPDHLVRRDSTGGSTGTPTQVWIGPEERGWAEGAGEHYMRRVGLPRWRSIAYLWGHHLDPITRETARERVQDWLTNTSWYDCLRLSDEVLLGYHARLERERPAGMIAYAGALASLAEALERAGLRPSYPTHALVTGAEKLFAHQRAAVERVFAAPVHERYGGRDAGLMAFQPVAGSTVFETNWGNVLIEPEHAPASPGEPSPILVTKLHADAMPMLRYRVGDMGRFPASARPGWPSLRLDEVVGRDTQRLWLPSGAWVHGITFPHLFKDYPIRDFQVVQAEDLAIEVRLVPAAGYAAGDEAAIRHLLAANLPGLPLTISYVTDIPRTRANKWQPVISAVRHARTAAGSAT